MYTIENDIPLSEWRKPKSEIRIAMEKMEIWQSFFMETIPELNNANSARQSIKWKKFSIKKWEKGFRCWRTK